MFFGYVVAIGGVVLAIVLLALTRFYPDAFNGVRGLVLDVTSPVTSSGRGAVRVVGQGGAAVGDYFRAGATNDELRAQIRDMRTRVLKARATELENQRLKAMVGLRELVQDEITTARIVSSSFDSSRRLATLSAGGSDGVRVGQPVRAPEGLIGRIVETGRWASRVLLVTDGASNVPVQLLRTGVPALATGRGDGTIEIKPLEVGKNPFRRGDIFITSGVGGIYAPGIPVAMVTRINGDETIARPIADPARLDFAIVQSIFQPAADQPLAAAPSAARALPPPPPAPVAATSPPAAARPPAAAATPPPGNAQ
jgi:rod shape-determining protein MreC